VAEFRRILLKLSGESLGQEGDALNHERIDYFIREIATALQHGCELAVVVGGGNFFRGANSALALDRVAADQIGMLATMMNSIALREALRRHHLEAELFTAVEMQAIARRFEKGIVIDHLERGAVVILSGGTGNPFFTTDTAAVLRAIELDCDVVLKGTRVDGVYEADPEQNPAAKRFRELSFAEVMQRELKVMDGTAFSLAKDNAMPLIVYNALQAGNLERLLTGEAVGTRVGV
jgi:uridylate kinase